MHTVLRQMPQTSPLMSLPVQPLKTVLPRAETHVVQARDRGHGEDQGQDDEERAAGRHLRSATEG